MKTQLKSFVCLLVAVASLAGGSLFGAEAIAPDLKKVSQGIGATLAGKTKARWDAAVKGEDALFATGIIWLDGANFTEGTIECDILGKSTPRGSNFPGVVFHGANDITFDCVYFRPFNFRAENPENARHAVQYVSLPQWTWQKLRAEKTGRPMPAAPAQTSNIALSPLLATTGQYEKPIAPPPDGNAWFHAKIVVAGKKVSVFVNGATKPSLEVEKLNDRTGGRIGITGGDAGDGGHFANLKITSKGK